MYWKPIYNLLEGDCEILVVNAQHSKAVPGRKTDVRDGEWMADLWHHGLLKASFSPSAPQRDLRDLTRHRTSLVQERARVVNRIQKVLEDLNSKLADVVSEVTGNSASRSLHALQRGESNAQRLAALAQGRVRASEEQLVRALEGRVTAHHRFMLGEHLRHLEELDVAIQRVTDEIARRFKPPEPPCASESSPEEPSEGERAEQEQEASSHEPAELGWQEAVQRIESVPGINERAAQGILTETGEAVAALSFGEALCLPGRSLSREQRKRGQATQRQDPQRQLPLASSLDPSGSCSSA